MGFLEQTLQNPAEAPEPSHSVGRPRGSRIALALIAISLIVVVGWAWLGRTNVSHVADQATTPVTVNAASNVTNEQAAPVRAVQMVTDRSTGQTPQPSPESAPAAAIAITTTHVTPSLVVIAGTAGATLLDMPGGTALQTLSTGTSLNATGRSADIAWLYASRADGIAGWVATSQVIAFGLEKLAVLDLPTAAPSTAGASSGVSETGVISTTTASMTETVTASVAAPAAAPRDAMLATVTVSGSRLNVRSGPGTRYGIIGKASAGEEVTVLARNAASDWVQIALPAADDADGGFGWVAATYLRLNSALAELPVSEATSAAPALVTEVAPLATTSAIQSAAMVTQPGETSAIATPAVTTSVVTSVVAVATAKPESMSQVVTSQIAAQAAGTTSVATGLSGTIVFQSSPGGMIYAYDLDAGRLWQLTSGFDPAISIDGQTVAFVRTAGENGIYLINIDGSNERLIFSGRSTLAAPKWSPDGSYILFTRGDEYKECRDLGRGLCLTDKELLDQNPNFPVDTFPLIKVYESNLARVDVHGGNYRDIANLESARAADWNEAGIVYQSTAGLQITADEPDATTQLVAHDAYRPAYEDPDWQPNGGRIVYVGRQSNHREIFAVNPDGSGIVALTQPVTTLVDELPSNVAPAWSPDGQHIVFLSNRGANYSAGAWRLWVMDADGRNQQPLPIEVTLTYNFGNEQVVSWGL